MKFRLLLVLSGIGLLGCGGSDDGESATPPGPVCSYISELRPRANETVLLPNSCDPDWAVVEGEVPLTIGCDRRLGVDVGLGVEENNWTFRQPAACGSAVQCGYVAVEFDFDPYALAPPSPCDPSVWQNPPANSGPLPDPSFSSCGESALNSTIVDLGSIAYLEGVHWLRAWLMNSDGTPFAHAADVPVTLSLEDCPAPEDAPAE